MSVKTMLTKSVITLLGFVVVVQLGAPALADKTVDDFESYNSGQIIGKSWDTKPWRRFGEATNDNVVATGVDGKVVSGRRSAEYGVFWPNRFGAIRFAFNKKVNLTEYATVSVKIRSSNPTTHTRVKLAISDGETTYLTTLGQDLTHKIQKLTFSLDPADHILADGSGSFKDVITSAEMIGLDFTSTEGQYDESIIFDDFELHNAESETPQQGSDW